MSGTRGSDLAGRDPEAFVELTARLDQICEAVGRDPATIGRSVGVFVDPDNKGKVEEIGFGPPISGSIVQITDTIAGFADVGMTRSKLSPGRRRSAYSSN